MEALWIYPIYIISPLIGLVLIVVGIIKIRNGKSKNILYNGLGFLAIPFIHLILLNIFQFDLSNEIQGTYNNGNKSEVLIIEDSGKFKLKNSNSYKNLEKGTWKIVEIDSPILILKFDSTRKTELWLEIKNNEKFTALTSTTMESNTETDFIKKKDGR